MFGRRLRALIVAALALVGLVWCAGRLRSLGAPFLPTFLGGLFPPALRTLGNQLITQAGAVALQFGAMLVVVLQLAVVTLGIVAVLALLMAIRRPRLVQHGGVTTFQAPRTAFGASTPVALTRQCPSCGRPVQADWVACPTCTNSLPVLRTA